MARFQFLIGKLKTAAPFDIYHHFIWFQFLIGKLKTVVYCVYNGSGIDVSIPHR